MKKTLLYLFLLFWGTAVSAQENPAYLLYSKSGKKVKYGKLLKTIGETEVLLFGEIHNNPIAHWLQLEITEDLIAAKAGKITLGAEMFESDNQLLLDEYFSEAISEKNFENEVRLWANYSTDYKPLVTLARSHQLPFIATNIPRRYANVVFRNGIEALESLSEEAKSYIAPLPIEIDLELSSYKSMLEMMGGHGQADSNFPKAQAIKDATMAWFITQNMTPGNLFIHYNGSFHSDLGEGIGWYLPRYRHGTKIVTIATVLQKDINTLDKTNKDLADFILCIPENMTTTH